ncbi:MAG: hypothetical protein DWQ01_07605 [Planctomycetota bacterium]|nr:MAG: hypothetical protein DWQ01_07605 [Planctomycetota bacterium]
MGRGKALHQAKLRMLRLGRAQNDGDAMPSAWGALCRVGSGADRLCVSIAKPESLGRYKLAIILSIGTEVVVLD